MKSSLLRVLAVVALSMPLASHAWVGTFKEKDLGDSIDFEGKAKHKGAFDDSFSFVVGANQTDAVVNVFAEDDRSFKVKDLTIALYKGSTLIDGDVTAEILKTGKHVHLELLDDSFSGLSAGTYTIDILGKFGRSGGAFEGGLTLSSAVPEPGTWAAMLVGLVLMTYIGSRRRHF